MRKKAPAGPKPPQEPPTTEQILGAMISIAKQAPNDRARRRIILATAAFFSEEDTVEKVGFGASS